MAESSKDRSEMIFPASPHPQNPKGAVAGLTLILPQVMGLHWDNTAASDFLNTAASDWIILPQVMGHPDEGHGPSKQQFDTSVFSSAQDLVWIEPGREHGRHSEST